MRAIVADVPGGPEVLTLRDIPVVEPGPGQARVRVAYSDLNPLDTHARAQRVAWNAPTFPFTPGYEYSGIVDIDRHKEQLRVEIELVLAEPGQLPGPIASAQVGRSCPGHTQTTHPAVRVCAQIVAGMSRSCGTRPAAPGTLVYSAYSDPRSPNSGSKLCLGPWHG